MGRGLSEIRNSRNIGFEVLECAVLWEAAGASSLMSIPVQFPSKLVLPVAFGALIAAVTPCIAAEITVSTKGFTFNPPSVNANPGDVIRFVRTGGSHTATSGSNCSPDGLFDAPLNLANPVFLWTVPQSAAGTTVAYYCNPHCFSGMDGVIVVGAGGGPPCDLNDDGFVNASDLAILLSSWGTAGPGDIDGNGVVEAPDLAILLGKWTG